MNDPAAPRPSAPDIRPVASGRCFHEKRAFLASGAAWPEEGPPLCVETPRSLVFLTRNRAFKLKKSLPRKGDDPRHMARRARDCAEDFTLNRALAPEVHLGLVPLVRAADGSLALGGQGRVVDWVMEMARLPAAQMLDRRLVSGPPPCRDDIVALATRLVASYRRDTSGWRAGAAYHARLTGALEADAGHLTGLLPRLGSFPLADLLGWARVRLALARPELRVRGVLGLLRTGPGGLCLEHLCLSDPPLVFHHVAVPKDGRLTDPYHDFAGLGLDAAELGAEWIGPVLLDHLAQSGLRPPSPRVLGLYAVLHCLTQARLAATPDPHLPGPHLSGALPAPGIDRLRRVLAMAMRIRDNMT